MPIVPSPTEPFQSAPPCRGRRDFSEVAKLLLTFQSAPPCRGRLLKPVKSSVIC